MSMDWWPDSSKYGGKGMTPPSGNRSGKSGNKGSKSSKGCFVFVVIWILLLVALAISGAALLVSIGHLP